MVFWKEKKLVKPICIVFNSIDKLAPAAFKLNMHSVQNWRFKSGGALNAPNTKNVYIGWLLFCNDVQWSPFSIKQPITKETFIFKTFFSTFPLRDLFRYGLFLNTATLFIELMVQIVWLNLVSSKTKTYWQQHCISVKCKYLHIWTWKYFCHIVPS